MSPGNGKAPDPPLKSWACGPCSVITPLHFVVEAAGALRRLERTGEVGRDRTRFALARLTQLVTPAAADELIVGAWALRDNLTVADAVYVVLARRSGAALMSTDERMLRDLRQFRGSGADFSGTEG